ncbi:hypothetical protein K7X08_026503 [Anisodus acutangulus]|uniref:Uncharacterized protein n=1 Tax=Anisodus acutangulus TaxID=402998 RepID=A0A9Q1R4Q9_9SOLA|nr:hypothetical protein K7X08_026503 [Anisodus acutangulus]
MVKREENIVMGTHDKNPIKLVNLQTRTQAPTSNLSIARSCPSYNVLHFVEDKGFLIGSGTQLTRYCQLIRVLKSSKWEFIGGSLVNVSNCGGI